jgi:hypothetical protein
LGANCQLPGCILSFLFVFLCLRLFRSFVGRFVNGAVTLTDQLLKLIALGRDPRRVLVGEVGEYEGGRMIIYEGLISTESSRFGWWMRMPWRRLYLCQDM